MVAAINLDVYTFWLSLTWPVTLLIQEYRFSDCTVPPDGKETKLPSVDQETFTGVFWMLCCPWKCVPSANIVETRGCNFLQLLSFPTRYFQYGSQKLLLGSVSPELTSNLSDFSLFWLSIKWSYYPN